MLWKMDCAGAIATYGGCPDEAPCGRSTFAQKTGEYFWRDESLELGAGEPTRC